MIFRLMSSDFQNCFELRKAPIFWAEAATVGKVRHKRLVREMRGCWWHNTCLIILSPSTSFPIKGSFGEGNGNAATVNKKLLNLQKVAPFISVKDLIQKFLVVCLKVPLAALDTRAKQKKFAKMFQEIYCQMCNKKFHTKSGFLIHQTIHKKYSKACPFCKLRLPTKFEFTAHSSMKLALKPPLASCDHDDSDEPAAEVTVGHDG
ncbi:hypothetical protein ACFX15_031823 [Malus domestica]